MNDQDAEKYAIQRWKKIPTDDRIIVVCRTCGEKWFYPKQYEQCFDADHPLENCAFCKRRRI